MRLAESVQLKLPSVIVMSCYPIKQWGWIAVFGIVLLARLSMVPQSLQFLLIASAPANAGRVKKLQVSNLLIVLSIS